MEREPLALIVAWSTNRVIGRAGGLPWHHPEDLRHFRRVTWGHAVIMGRRTHASIGRALPGRRNLVVTRNAGYEAPGCEMFGHLPAAIAAARTSDDCPFVIGGAEIFALALPLATRLVVTEILEEVEGDVRFPDFDQDAWREVERHDASSGALRFLELRRVG